MNYNKQTIYIIFILLQFFTISLYAECIRTPLPPPTGKTIIVKTVNQLHKAVKQANKGGNTTIVLKQGTYLLKGPLIIKAKNITIRSDSGDREDVIVKGKGMKGQVTNIFLVQGSYFTVADMTIGWVKHHAIQIQGVKGAINPLIHNVRFVNTGQHMLKVTGFKKKRSVENGVVEWSVFEFPAGTASQHYTGGIDAHYAKNWIVRNNKFIGIKSPNNKLADHAILFWSNSENTLVENNIISNSDRGIGFGLGKKRGHIGGIIRNNMVHTNRDIAIGLESSSGTKVYNNTVFTENYKNSIEYRFPRTKGVIIQNNLANKGIKSRKGGEAKVSNNIDTAEEKLFVNPKQGDLHLRSGLNKVLNQGVFIEGLSNDIDCNARPKEKIDIGAQEYQKGVNIGI